MRDAPALTIVPTLVGSVTKVRVVSLQGQREGEALLLGVSWMDNAYEPAQGAHAAMIITEWNELSALDLSQLAQAMNTTRMADLRNIEHPTTRRQTGSRFAPQSGDDGNSVVWCDAVHERTAQETDVSEERPGQKKCTSC